MEFQTLGSIKEFNKVFNQNLNQANTNLSMQGDAFNAIFNEKMQDSKLSAGVNMTVGLDAINAQKIENLSETEKFAKNVSNSITGGIESLNAKQKEAEHAVETLASGGDISIHDVMIASQKSSLAMQMAIQLRNQMLNTYNEFKNMQI